MLDKDQYIRNYACVLLGAIKEESMEKIFRVYASPFTWDTGFPWDYKEEAFVSWFDEVFREGYKRDNPPISSEDCLLELRRLGYGVSVHFE